MAENVRLHVADVANTGSLGPSARLMMKNVQPRVAELGDTGSLGPSGDLVPCLPTLIRSRTFDGKKEPAEAQERRAATTFAKLTQIQADEPGAFDDCFNEDLVDEHLASVSQKASLIAMPEESVDSRPLEFTRQRLRSRAGSGQHAPPDGACVRVHLHNLNDTWGHINDLLVDWIGVGALHVSVEVFGWEWTYGISGVGRTCASSISADQRPHYRQTLHMGCTQCSRAEVEDTLALMALDWRGSDYNLLNHNCGSFCDQLCQRLGVGGLPAWVTRLPDVVNNVPRPIVTALLGPVDFGQTRVAPAAVPERPPEQRMPSTRIHKKDRSRPLPGGDLVPTPDPADVKPTPMSNSVRTLVLNAENQGTLSCVLDERESSYAMVQSSYLDYHCLERTSVGLDVIECVI